MAKQLPLIVVLGATACGKSKLAIELARRFSGEIISADSMQVYTGLDIVTNKVTEDEQSQAKHHMINILDPSQRCSVVDFRNRSLDIIGNLLKNNSLPIVVGGTNYYIESLLWKSFLIQDDNQSKRKVDDYIESSETSQPETLIDTEYELLKSLTKEDMHTEDDLIDVDKFFNKPIYNDAFVNVPSEKLWHILEKTDSESAYLYHPNDKRRIIRCLQIIQRKRKNYSDLLKEVNLSSTSDKSSLGGPLRFKETCVLWLSCDNELLDKILDERVEQMMDRGLLAELERFHEDYNRQRINDGVKPDYEKGIFQTIGFKEFHDYLMLNPDVKETEEGNKMLKKSIDSMKISTKQYAKRQLKWIRRRFLQEGTRDLPTLFKLTTSLSEDHWREEVREPVFKIVESFINGEPISDDLLRFKQEAEKQSVVNKPEKFHCEACDRVFIGSHQVKSHLESRSHEKMVSKLKHKKLKSQVNGDNVSS